MKNQTVETPDEIKLFSTFFIDDTHIGVDINLVQEINESPVITPVPLAQDYVRGIMNLRGQIITIVDLRKKLGFEPLEDEEGQNGVVIVKWRNENIGLLVDKISDVVESPACEIEPSPSNIQGTSGQFFYGVIYTQSNDILALLNIDSLLEEED